jgi:hypothetical protein
MVAEFKVLVTCPAEDVDGNEPVKAVLRVLDGQLTLSRYLTHKRGGCWLTWKSRLFRGPWPLQLVLTPLFSFNGILFSKGNLSWLGADTNEHRLRITPLVPAEFWVVLISAFHLCPFFDEVAASVRVQPDQGAINRAGSTAWLRCRLLPDRRALDWADHAATRAS